MRYKTIEMPHRKIIINDSNHIRIYEDDTFEVYCRVSGPIGEVIYGFKRGRLEWKQIFGPGWKTDKLKVKTIRVN
jgi:hypothetical protein